MDAKNPESVSKRLCCLPSPLSISSSAKAGLELFLHRALEIEPPFCEGLGPPLNFGRKTLSQEPPAPSVAESLGSTSKNSSRPPLLLCASSVGLPLLPNSSSSSHLLPRKFCDRILHLLPPLDPQYLQRVCLRLEGMAPSYAPRHPDFKGLLALVSCCVQTR